MSELCILKTFTALMKLRDSEACTREAHKAEKPLVRNLTIYASKKKRSLRTYVYPFMLADVKWHVYYHGVQGIYHLSLTWY